MIDELSPQLSAYARFHARWDQRQRAHTATALMLVGFDGFTLSCYRQRQSDGRFCTPSRIRRTKIDAAQDDARRVALKLEVKKFPRRAFFDPVACAASIFARRTRDRVPKLPA